MQLGKYVKLNILQLVDRVALALKAGAEAPPTGRGCSFYQRIPTLWGKTR